MDTEASDLMYHRTSLLPPPAPPSSSSHLTPRTTPIDVPTNPRRLIVEDHRRLALRSLLQGPDCVLGAPIYLHNPPFCLRRRAQLLVVGTLSLTYLTFSLAWSAVCGSSHRLAHHLAVHLLQPRPG